MSNSLQSTKRRWPSFSYVIYQLFMKSSDGIEQRNRIEKKKSQRKTWLRLHIRHNLKFTTWMWRERNNINKRHIIKQLEMVVLTLKRANKDYSKWEDKRTPFRVACWTEHKSIIDPIERLHCPLNCGDCTHIYTIKRRIVSVWLAIKPI